MALLAAAAAAAGNWSKSAEMGCFPQTFSRKQVFFQKLSKAVQTGKFSCFGLGLVLLATMAPFDEYYISLFV